MSVPANCRVRKPVGIDLGTTNSVIALLDATDSGLIVGQDEHGRRTFPSVLGYHPDHRRLVAGRAALALMAADRPDPVACLPLASVKRHMGLDRVFAVGPEQLTPPQASAEVLRLLRDMLARTLNDARYLLDAAVITMPAYFNHEQIEATRQAGELAGFEVLELLHEPTAAALYYAWLHGHEDATYLVYDLGGGTFDVSVIRRRLGDCEVLGVSGDPFLGGDDFDRLLASHLLEQSGRPDLAPLFDPRDPAGAVPFARLVRVAEGMKTELTDADRVSRSLPAFVHVGGKAVDLDLHADRATFNRLIRDKVDRTIACCHEALARARERAGVRLADVDHVILVGGSSRVPLVRETVRAAFCNPALAEHVRSPELLLHEPDLCVAYGAALRAATYGQSYRVQGSGVRGQGSGKKADGTTVEIHLTSPVNTRETTHQLTGKVRLRSSLFPDPRPLAPDPCSLAPDPWLDGASVRIRSLATGLIEEAFLDARGTFAQDLELIPETDNAFELTLCDGDGREMAAVLTCVRHTHQARSLGQAVLPTQIITKPLQIEVVGHAGYRVKQVVAPVGAALPGVFRCTCRTRDHAGRVVVPIFEENRVIKQMVLDDLDASLPVGTPVEVEFAIDLKHQLEVRVRVPATGRQRERCESATIVAAPPPRRPTRTEIDEVQRQIEELLPSFNGAARARWKARGKQLGDDLLEALRYNDEPKAIQRMAELRELLQQMEASRGQALDPPWPRFAQLVRHCLDRAADVASATGRDRDELFEHVHAQERYAERAFEEQNQPLYRECNANLEKYAGYLEQLLRDTLPRPQAADLPPEEAARHDLGRFRAYLAAVWKQVRERQRTDLEARLQEVARQAAGLTAKLKDDPHAVGRETHRLGTEVHKVEEALKGGRRPAGDDSGLLEGSA